MTTVITCVHCGKSFSTFTEGMSRVECKHCKQILMVPKATAAKEARLANAQKALNGKKSSLQKNPFGSSLYEDMMKAQIVHAKKNQEPELEDETTIRTMKKGKK